MNTIIKACSIICTIAVLNIKATSQNIIKKNKGLKFLEIDCGLDMVFKLEDTIKRAYETQSIDYLIHDRKGSATIFITYKNNCVVRYQYKGSNKKGTEKRRYINVSDGKENVVYFKFLIPTLVKIDTIETKSLN